MNKVIHTAVVAVNVSDLKHPVLHWTSVQLFSVILHIIIC